MKMVQVTGQQRQSDELAHVENWQAQFQLEFNFKPNELNHWNTFSNLKDALQNFQII